MTYWNILEIPEDTDVAGIKLAYATKLKSTRPDINPEQFKQLHLAYKQALAAAKRYTASSVFDATHSDIHIDDNAVVISTEVKSQTPVNTDTSVSEEQSDRLSDTERHFEILLKQASEVISEPNRRNKHSEWEFLIESPAILEPWIHAQLGLYVFNEIYRIHSEARDTKNKSYSKRKRYLAPNAEVAKSTVLYLNDVFHWTSQQEQLRFYIEPTAYKFVFALLSESYSNKEQQKALQSVKGSRIVLGQQSHSESALEKHIKRKDALAKVKSMTINSLTLIIVILFIIMLMTLSEAKFVNASILLLSIVISGIFAIFVWMENKYAYYFIWVYAIILLFWFPIGTFLGGRLLYNLYASNEE
jgi:hypothetical protein